LHVSFFVFDRRIVESGVEDPFAGQLRHRRTDAARNIEVEARADELCEADGEVVDLRIDAVSAECGFQKGKCDRWREKWPERHRNQAHAPHPHSPPYFTIALAMLVL